MNTKNVPVLGQGQQPTEAEMNMMRRAKRVQLATQFMGAMLSNIPLVSVSDDKYDHRIMTPNEVFEYSMGLVNQVDMYIEAENATEIIQ